MPLFRLLSITAIPFCLAASCAVDPVTVYGPAPGTAAAAAPAGPAITPMPFPEPRSGLIAACGHAGASPVGISYPDGWQTRLAQRPQTASSGGELLGGPPEPGEVTDSNAQPIDPPKPAFPASAVNAGREGRCETLFNVSIDGHPEDILTACSSPEFNAPTYLAAMNMRFRPRVEGGLAVRRINTVYPVNYCLEGQVR